MDGGAWQATVPPKSTSSVVVPALSGVRLFVTPWTEAPRVLCPPLSLEFVQTHVHWLVMLSNQLILCSPLILLPFSFNLPLI